MSTRALGVAIGGVGARSHLGLNALQIATATRAFLLEPRATPFLDTHGGRAGLAFASTLPPGLVGFDRFVALGAPALAEACAPPPSPKAKTREPAPLILALPEADRPDQAADPRFEGEIVEALARASGIAIDPRASAIVRAGHAGFAHALARAKAMLADHPRGVIVGAIESPFHPDVPRWLDERGRLLRVDHEGEPVRIPGEAAAFLRLDLRPEGSAEGRRGWLRAVETEDEEGDPTTRAAAGRSMGRLLRRVARSPRRGSLTWFLTDVNGEPPRTKGWLAAYHAARDLLEAAEEEHPVEYTSEVGAATGALLAVLAMTWAWTGAVVHPNALIATSADGAERGVFVLDLPKPQGPFSASRDAVQKHALSVEPGAITPTEAERSQMAHAARACLEEIGSMALMLQPRPPGLDDEGDEGDTSAEQHERRLWDAYDALVALGIGMRGAIYEPDLLALVDAYLREKDPPDRARIIACDFVRDHVVSGAAARTRKEKGART